MGAIDKGLQFISPVYGYARNTGFRVSVDTVRGNINKGIDGGLQFISPAYRYAKNAGFRSSVNEVVDKGLQFISPLSGLVKWLKSKV